MLVDQRTRWRRGAYFGQNGSQDRLKVLVGMVVMDSKTHRNGYMYIMLGWLDTQNTAGAFGNGQGKGGQGGGGHGTFTGNPSAFGAGAANSGGGAGGDNGSGGSGVVVVRYKIAALSSTAKATGGLISFTPSRTIHTFLSPGTFTVTNGPVDVDYLVVGGGGGGGSCAGGGGAGLLRYATGTTVANGPYGVTIGSGGAGGAAGADNPGADGGITTLSLPSALHVLWRRWCCHTDQTR